jgi:hypothetical protein
LVNPRPYRHFPQNEDICKERGQRSMQSFKDHCLKLFPVNCVFASSSQISQTAKEFCDVWGLSSTCLGKKIVCYYGKSPTHNQLQRVNLGVTRMRVPSLKSQECPSARSRTIRTIGPTLFYEGGGLLHVAFLDSWLLSSSSRSLPGFVRSIEAFLRSPPSPPPAAALRKSP